MEDEIFIEWVVRKAFRQRHHVYRRETKRSLEGRKVWVATFNERDEAHGQLCLMWLQFTIDRLLS